MLGACGRLRQGHGCSSRWRCGSRQRQRQRQQCLGLSPLLRLLLLLLLPFAVPC